MPHVVQPLFDTTYAVALSQLETAHQHLVRCAQDSLLASTLDATRWGIQTKRLVVDLTDNAPDLIGKRNEKFGEIINIAATIERLIPAIRWFSLHSEFKALTIRECHPSTSDENGGNDLVLIDSDGNVYVRCEVCDVASSNAGSNGKEKKDIRNLGCTQNVPDDSVARYICTAPEFAVALTNPKRKWKQLPYQYKCTTLGDVADTRLLRVVPAEEIAT